MSIANEELETDLLRVDWLEGHIDSVVSTAMKAPHTFEIEYLEGDAISQLIESAQLKRRLLGQTQTAPTCSQRQLARERHSSSPR